MALSRTGGRAEFAFGLQNSFLIGCGFRRNSSLDGFADVHDGVRNRTGLDVIPAPGLIRSSSCRGVAPGRSLAIPARRQRSKPIREPLEHTSAIWLSVICEKNGSARAALRRRLGVLPVLAPRDPQISAKYGCW